MFHGESAGTMAATRHDHSGSGKKLALHWCPFLGKAGLA
jgi:hypothetical protein